MAELALAYFSVHGTFFPEAREQGKTLFDPFARQREEELRERGLMPPPKAAKDLFVHHRSEVDKAVTKTQAALEWKEADHAAWQAKFDALKEKWHKAEQEWTRDRLAAAAAQGKKELAKLAKLALAEKALEEEKKKEGKKKDKQKEEEEEEVVEVEEVEESSDSKKKRERAEKKAKQEADKKKKDKEDKSKASAVAPGQGSDEDAESGKKKKSHKKHRAETTEAAANGNGRKSKGEAAKPDAAKQRPPALKKN